MKGPDRPYVQKKDKSILKKVLLVGIFDTDTVSLAPHILRAYAEQFEISSKFEIATKEFSIYADSLESITRAVTTINEMNTMIASAAEEQTSVAEDMNRNIVNISQLSHDTAGAAEQTTSASTELSKLASQLESLVNQFKLSA